MPAFEPQRRKSFVETGALYFWTATINGWKHLLADDAHKQVIVDSLQYLSEAEKIEVFGFVIMPNHIHLIWRIRSPRGKESPQGSLLKFTAHRFLSNLRQTASPLLNAYAVRSRTKNFEFWRRDSLAIPLFTLKVAYQKLEYLHNNPLASHWHLATLPADYWFSSASFYERNDRRFSFLKHLGEIGSP
jgi:putative transposase